jgi:hypothetical protein
MWRWMAIASLYMKSILVFSTDLVNLTNVGESHNHVQVKHIQDGAFDQVLPCKS